MMNWKEFFKPNLKKFILPVVLIVFLIVALLITLNYMSYFGDNGCFIDKGQKELQVLRDKNDSAGFAKKVNELMDEARSRQANVSAWRTSFVFYANTYIGKIDPYYPVPCLINSGKLCASYISAEQNQCLKDMINDSEGFGKLYGTNESLDYREMNYVVLAVNLAGIFVVGYLISCLIFFPFFRKH